MRLLASLFGTVCLLVGALDRAVAQNVLYNPPNAVIVTKGRVFAGPDPNVEQHLYGLLADSEVRQHLGFSDEQCEGLKEAMAKAAVPAPSELYRDPTAMAAFRQEQKAALLEVFREVVTPEHLAKLKALAYRYEVSAIGLPVALTTGRLSDEVGIYANQHERILRIGAEIEARLRDDILRLRKEAELQLLQQLTPAQREKANEVLADYFLHQDVRAVSELYNEKRSQNQAKVAQELKDSKASLPAKK